MKKFLIVFLLFTTASVSAKTTCTIGDLQGQWSVNYFLTKPQQVGECTLVLDNKLNTFGNCHNITYDYSSDIAYGSGTITNSCSVKGTMYLEDGQKITFNLKVAPDKQTMTGTIKSTYNQYKYSGKTTLTKSGSLSCQVIPNSP